MKKAFLDCYGNSAVFHLVPPSIRKDPIYLSGVLSVMLKILLYKIIYVQAQVKRKKI